jgi:hypothetical protein
VGTSRELLRSALCSVIPAFAGMTEQGADAMAYGMPQAVDFPGQR